MPPTAGILPVGVRLAGYRILALVGRGGMGEVYRARQESMERDVALKVLAPHLGRDRNFAKQFVSEARAAGRLHHPCVVAVHDVGVAPAPAGCAADEGEPLYYYSMEFIEGETLKERIEREGALDLAVVARVMESVVEALVFAEAQGIVHRDIKPDNIMLGENGLVKLADLGLAKHVGAESALDERARGKVVGTPLYMAPEQARGEPVDHRADQYALGATLFHMLTGRPPYTGPNAKAIMRAHCFDPVPDPLEVNPQVPSGWAALCQRLLAKDPAQRFADARALRAAVQALTQRRPARARPLRRSWSLWAGGVVALAALGGTIWLLLQEGPKPQVSPISAGPPPAPLAPRSEPTPSALATAQRLLAQLPDDAEAALAQLERALADEALRPAHPLLRERRAAIVAQREERQRERWRALLTGIAQDIAAQRYRRARQSLAELPAESWLEEPRRRLTTDLERAQDERAASWSLAIAGAANADDLERIERELEASELEERWRLQLSLQLNERRGELRASALRSSARPWSSVVARLEERRGVLPYAAFSSEARSLAADGGSADERETLLQLAKVGELAQEAETAVRIGVTRSYPRLQCRIAGSEMAITLHGIERDTVSFMPAGRTTVQRVARASIELPWPELLARFLQGPTAAQQRAAFLWFWRHSAASEALAALGEDPLALAIRRLTDRTEPAAGRLAFDYSFAVAPREAWLHDWQGAGLGLTPQGLSWQAPAGLAGTREADLPTLRWTRDLALPVSLTAVLRPHPGSDVIAIGLSDGRQRLRVALNPRRQAFVLATREQDSESYEALAMVPLPYDPQRETRIAIEVAGNGAFAARVDGQLLATPRALSFPAQARLSVIIQARPQRSAAGIVVSRLTIEGGP
ncbi:MAG: serine/threonine protein kinase [Planctomycetes bacterium]|nr:serine/threonine protein kinase [Planctomycetota bacterium]